MEGLTVITADSFRELVARPTRLTAPDGTASNKVLRFREVPVSFEVLESQKHVLVVASASWPLPQLSQLWSRSPKTLRVP